MPCLRRRPTPPPVATPVRRPRVRREPQPTPATPTPGLPVVVCSPVPPPRLRPNLFITPNRRRARQSQKTTPKPLAKPKPTPKPTPSKAGVVAGNSLPKSKLTPRKAVEAASNSPAKPKPSPSKAGVVTGSGSAAEKSRTGKKRVLASDTAPAVEASVDTPVGKSEPEPVVQTADAKPGRAGISGEKRAESQPPAPLASATAPQTKTASGTRGKRQSASAPAKTTTEDAKTPNSKKQQANTSTRATTANAKTRNGKKEQENASSEAATADAKASRGKKKQENGSTSAATGDGKISSGEKEPENASVKSATADSKTRSGRRQQTNAPAKGATADAKTASGKKEQENVYAKAVIADAKTPTRSRQERATNVGKSASAPVRKTPRLAQANERQVVETTDQTMSKGKTKARSEVEAAGTDSARSRSAKVTKPKETKTPSRTRAAIKAATTRGGRTDDTDSVSEPLAEIAEGDEVTAPTAADSRSKTGSENAGKSSKSASTGPITAASSSASVDGGAATTSSTSDVQMDSARPADKLPRAGTSPLKRPRTAAPSDPVDAAAFGTPSKKQRLGAMPATKAVAGQEEAAPSPTRFTGILPRPPLPPAPLSSVAPAAPAVVREPLPPAAATPQRRRLPRHVTSTPCGPAVPPAPAADSAQTCYGFLEDMEEAEEAEGSAPLEEVVSPVGVRRARPPLPARSHRLRDTTNLPSRFTVGRLTRKPAGERSEVTTTVASQLMDPEITFSKPASRSYSRRRHPSASAAGHSTLGHSTLGSEAGSTAGDSTRTKHRRHHRERDEQVEAELDRWAALVNSRMSEVDSFELVVERG
ncbi:proteoglycan 4-like [Amphibalanus amphitrite]|uniref:proteoglycan 4-like n=1 Tax=Amphibalanus amphitrite TaxID=1232801 RepID=UPI001C926BD7|nr:proteoglycan 4-like [Amphibalanus amphitrite]XP_043194539.1 proteoglycan 4-like [Amphibalanus amphitrite]XP_043228849.1 proteoglycan 4-like [Amphibalanus amphitrite]XP_043228851.1 proteoglycan 4-like [Amphibalanus amphitrite]